MELKVDALFVAVTRQKCLWVNPKLQSQLCQRKEKTIETMSTTLVAFDHSTCRASVTPSVALQCELPGNTTRCKRCPLFRARSQWRLMTLSSNYQYPSPMLQCWRRLPKEKSIGDPQVHRWGNRPKERNLD